MKRAGAGALGVVWSLATVGLLAAMLMPTARPTESWSVIIGGENQGYLSPCGCVKPMSGGLRRRVTAALEWNLPGRTLTLETGRLVRSDARQDQLKAEALAQGLRAMRVDAIHATDQDLRLAPGIRDSVARLSQAAWIAGNAGPGAGIPETFEKGPFLVGAITADAPGADSAVQRLLQEAQGAELVPVLMTTGNENSAREMARRFPGLRLIVYRSQTQPPPQALREGSTWLVSPGEKGKAVVRLVWNGRAWEGYQWNPLGPDVDNHPEAQRIFDTYLDRVRDEKLLEALPRDHTAAFAGSKACAPCHPAAYKVWRESQHATALGTLEQERQDRDPDCVSCHVVGLESTQGFRDRKTTPDLADVGCESCHGPGKMHVMNPVEHPLPKIDERSCFKCHNNDHSPGFNFKKAWPKIQH